MHSFAHEKIWWWSVDFSATYKMFQRWYKDQLPSRSRSLPSRYSSKWEHYQGHNAFWRYRNFPFRWYNWPGFQIAFNIEIAYGWETKFFKKFDNTIRFSTVSKTLQKFRIYSIHFCANNLGNSSYNSFPMLIFSTSWENESIHKIFQNYRWKDFASIKIS